jgi:outer membrane protein TolC
MKHVDDWLLAAAFVVAPAIVAAQAPVTAPPSSERLTLDAAITEALEKNLDLIARRAGITIAEANVVTARLRPNPVFTLGGDHLDFLGTGFSDETVRVHRSTARASTFCWNAGRNARGASRWPRKSARLPRQRSSMPCAP